MAPSPQGALISSSPSPGYSWICSIRLVPLHCKVIVTSTCLQAYLVIHLLKKLLNVRKPIQVLQFLHSEDHLFVDQTAYFQFKGIFIDVWYPSMVPYTRKQVGQKC